MKIKSLKSQIGFTLIELLVVFFIMTTLAGVSIAAFVQYGNTQKLTTAAQDVTATLQVAKSRAFSQVKPSQCANSDEFSGYKVVICCKGGYCSSCQAYEGYNLLAVCGAKNISISTTKFISGTSIGSGTTSDTFYFNAISGGVDGAGKVVLTGYGGTKKITITQTGVIQ